MEIAKITPKEAAQKSSGFPVWLYEIDPDGQKTGRRIHHLTKEVAVVE